MFWFAEMKLALFAPNPQYRGDVRLERLLGELASCDVYEVSSRDELRDGTDMLLSVGGDGTFLSAASILAGTGVPVLGINLGRLGFLSEYRPEDAAKALIAGDYEIEDREMLRSSINGGEDQFSLNEVSVHRRGAAMLGVNVTLNGEALPTYWADGLLVATSSGSTAYSLSVGGPICTPDSKVLIIAPIAPHNLNVRPLIVPSSTRVGISLTSRDSQVMLTRDNRNEIVGCDTTVSISVAQFSLRRVRLQKSNFIGALKSKLFWGEDVRNETEL